ncbi:hypothetical protein IMSAGC009_01116 [Lachnospiraceae bacterium]|nr:hypothetical protein IMSAGC009_01116 [Lachnospiraceae bacterium]
MKAVGEHKLLTISSLMIIKQDEPSTLPLKMERLISKMVFKKLILLLIWMVICILEEDILIWQMVIQYKRLEL